MFNCFRLIFYSRFPFFKVILFLCLCFFVYKVFCFCYIMQFCTNGQKQIVMARAKMLQIRLQVKIKIKVKIKVEMLEIILIHFKPIIIVFLFGFAWAKKIGIILYFCSLVCILIFGKTSFASSLEKIIHQSLSCLGRYVLFSWEKRLNCSLNLVAGYLAI